MNNDLNKELEAFVTIYKHLHARLDDLERIFDIIKIKYALIPSCPVGDCRYFSFKINAKLIVSLNKAMENTVVSYLI